MGCDMAEFCRWQANLPYPQLLCGSLVFSMNVSCRFLPSLTNCTLTLCLQVVVLYEKVFFSGVLLHLAFSSWATFQLLCCKLLPLLFSTYLCTKFGAVFHLCHVSKVNQLVIVDFFQKADKIENSQWLSVWCSRRHKLALLRWSFHDVLFSCTNVFNMLTIVLYLRLHWPFPDGWYGLVQSRWILHNFDKCLNRPFSDSLPWLWRILPGMPKRRIKSL